MLADQAVTMLTCFFISSYFLFSIHWNRTYPYLHDSVRTITPALKILHTQYGFILTTQYLVRQLRIELS